MTELQERVARLETRQDAIEKLLSDLDAKVDKLLAVANMGRGAWLFAMKAGGVLAALVGLGKLIWDFWPHK